MNEKNKMYTAVIGAAIGSLTLAGALAFASVSDTNVGSSDTESIKQQMWISEDVSVDEYFENRKNTGQIEDTEWKNAPEIKVNEDALSSMPTVDETVDKKEAKKKISENNWEIPKEVNLEVTFFSQAPDGVWTLPWKEACEEASIAQAIYFVRDEPLSKATYKEDINNLTELVELKYWNGRVDTNMKETAEILESYYWYTDYEIIDNPSVEQLKQELAQWHPIVAPFAGKKLGNSFFTDGGPRYHVLVIVWYNEEFFLTNDVWTSRGENFTYSYETIMDSLHDFVPTSKGDITDGAKRVIVLR